MKRPIIIIILIVLGIAVVAFIWSQWDKPAPVEASPLCQAVEGTNLSVVPSTDPLAFVQVDGRQVKLLPFAFEPAGSVIFFQADFVFQPGKMVEYGYPQQWQAVVAQAGTIPVDATLYPYAVATCGQRIVIWRTNQIPMSPAVAQPQPAGVMPSGSPTEGPTELPAAEPPK